MIRLLSIFSVLLIAMLSACSTSNKVQLPSSSVRTEGEATLEKDFLLVEAMKYHVLGDPSSALALVNQSIRRDSLCSACYYLQSDIYAGAGMYQQALEAVNKAQAIDSTNRWYQLMQANVTMRAGDVSTAIDQFENLIEKYGYNADVYFSLANLYGASNNFDAAAAILDSLELHEGFNEQVSLSRQQLYYSMGYGDKSLEEAKKLNEYSPNNPQFVTLVGDAYAREGDITNAKEYYNKALTIDSLYFPADLGLMDVYRRQESYKDFFNGLRKVSLNKRVPMEEKARYISLVASDPVLGKLGVPWLNAIFTDMSPIYASDWGFTNLHVVYLAQTGQEDVAVKVLESYMAQPTYKSTKEVQELYLSLLNNAQQWDKLVVKTDEAIKTDSKNVQLYVMKGLGQWQSNKLSEATKTLNTALKHTSDSTQRYDIYALMGDIYHLNGDKKKAYSSYEKALEINPEGIVVLNNYAYYLSEEGDRLTDALKMSKKVIEVEPSNPTYLDTYGWILYKMGLYDEAKNTFRQAMMYGGRSEAVLLDHYGDVLFALKEYDTAIVYYEFALEAVGVENPDAIKAKIEKAKALK